LTKTQEHRYCNTQSKQVHFVHNTKKVVPAKVGVAT